MFKMKTLKVIANINAEEKEIGDAVLSSLGLSADEAVGMLYHKLSVNKKLPFVDDGRRPYNQETIDAMNEDMTDYPRFKNMKDVLEHVESEIL